MKSEYKNIKPGNDEGQDERFDQLLDLAKEGVDEAIDDLWTQYGFDFRSGRYSEGRGLDLEDRTDFKDGEDQEGGEA